MLERIKGKGLSLAFTGIAAVLAIVTAVLGSVQHAMVQNTSFDITIVICVVVSVVLTVANLFINLHFLPLLISAGYSLALGLIIKGGAEVINDHMLNIQFSGGNFPQVVVYMVLMGVAVILCIVNCFTAKTPAK